SPNSVPFQCPLVAIATAPAFPRLLSQHPIVVDSVVEEILGDAHQVAVRRGIVPSTAEIICHGGTCSEDGLEINTTPDERTSFVTDLLSDLAPKLATRS